PDFRPRILQTRHSAENGDRYRRLLSCPTVRDDNRPKSDEGQVAPTTRPADRLDRLANSLGNRAVGSCGFLPYVAVGTGPIIAHASRRRRPWRFTCFRGVHRCHSVLANEPRKHGTRATRSWNFSLIRKHATIAFRLLLAKSFAIFNRGNRHP